MFKNDRNYLLRVQGRDGLYTEIAPPFTLQLDVKRNFSSTTSHTNLRVYNLSKDTRDNLRKDEILENTIPRGMTLQAGYGKNISIICSGNIRQCFSAREGVDFVTDIETFDGGLFFNKAWISRSYVAGSLYRDIVIDLIKSIPDEYGVTIGNVGTIEGSCKRDLALAGSAIDILRDLTGDTFFVDNGKGNVLSNSEYIQGNVLTIDSSSGLLGTPKRRNNFIELDILFEPSIYIGQLVIVDSTTASGNINGNWIVMSISHKGVISSSVSGSLITSLSLSKEGTLTPTTQEKTT